MAGRLRRVPLTAEVGGRRCLALFSLAAGGGREALGSLPSPCVLAGLGRAQATGGRPIWQPLTALGSTAAVARTVGDEQAARVASAVVDLGMGSQPSPPGVSLSPGAGLTASWAPPASIPTSPMALLEWFPALWADSLPLQKARSSPFLLSDSLTPVPRRIWDKILDGKLVDFSDLLLDNLELRRRESEQGIWFAPRTPMRRQTTLLSWVQAYASYVAVIPAKPHRESDLMAYLHLLVREAQRWGGSGWLEYD